MIAPLAAAVNEKFSWNDVHHDTTGIAFRLASTRSIDNFIVITINVQQPAKSVKP